MSWIWGWEGRGQWVGFKSLVGVMACKDVAQEVLWWVSLDSSVHALSMNWWQKHPPGCCAVVAQPQLGTYSGSVGCRNTCCWWDREEENGKYPMCLQRKRTWRVLWSQAFVGFSLFGWFMLLGGFLEELQNSALMKATFRLQATSPVGLSVCGESSGCGAGTAVSLTDCLDWFLKWSTKNKASQMKCFPYPVVFVVM